MSNPYTLPKRARRPVRRPLHPRLTSLLLALAAACSAGNGTGSGGGPGNNRPPVASAGGDRDVLLADLVALDGSASHDPDGDPLRYRWTLRARPVDSTAAIEEPAAATARFLVDRVGEYRVELVVSDGIATSDAVQVSLTAGPDDSLRVGPSRALRSPSAAANVAQDGDVVRIDAGVYRGDVATWTRNDLRLVASGGEVQLIAEGEAAQGKAIWVVAGSRTTIEGITFDGCRVNDGNGAGVRLEGGAFLARDCRFLRNQMGFLCGDLPQTDLVFEGCEFGWSQSDGALAHGLYVNRARSLELRHCFVHDASRGHLVKSRAAQTRILWSRIVDLAAGSSSYTIDLPDGGLAILVGNVIQKGVDSQNETAVSFAEEHHGVHATDELVLAHNTVVIDRRSGAFVHAAHGTARLVNNVFCGPGPVLTGAGSQQDNLQSQTPGFVDRAAFDYRLGTGSPAIDAGLPPGLAHGVALSPAFEYRDVAACVARVDGGAADLGAFAAAIAP